VVYASSTTALATGSAFTWSGSALAVTGTINTSVGATTTNALSINATTAGYGSVVTYQTGGVTKYTAGLNIVTGTGEWGIYDNSAGTTRFYLNSSGNLGIGTTGPSYTLDVYNASSGVIAQISGPNAYNAESGILLSSSRAKISGFLNGSGGTPGASLRFYTQPDGGSLTEAMRIDSNGNLLVGTTGSGFNGGFALNPSAGNTSFTIGHVTGTASGQPYTYFTLNNSVVGSITQNGTTGVLYNITSDQRLKENIQDSESASSLIDSLQVRQFDWKSDNSHQRYGFVAQELVLVAPEAVYQPRNEEEMMAVDYSKLVPMLVKEIQSLRKRILTLENK